ncbi:hypothetical protein AD952_05685 [Acetobacter cerevisiae]|uniref:CBM6 domain-containing protein n=1 Tax=Acetobacter cerevisiae TaxID=178900 RepID=A0A149UWS9_9PROT|nr:glycoside hydrolase family 66 protein [Acetobacter cerevisiae]KXV72203.1 hypothetical protein AD952_05685 [Acetobacter cerevisiae]
MKKIALSLLCGFIPFYANAASLNGPLIKHVTDDKAFYSAGETAHVFVTLTNGTGSSYTGNVVLGVCSRGTLISSTTAAVTSLATTTSQTLSMSAAVPTLNAHGYQLVVNALTSSDTGTVSCTDTGSTSSSPVDVASGAINVAANAQEDPIEGYVDPQAMQGADYNLIADNLAQYHTNIIQFYDWGYRHDAPYTSDATWENLESVPVTKDETTGLIKAFGKYGVFTQLYTSWNGAYIDWPTKDTNITVGMGVYKNQCGLTNSCTVNDQFVTSSGWSGWGWQTDGSVQENPANGNWMAWISTQYKLAMTGWGFSGVHIDTMGDPNETLYDSHGRELPNLGEFIANFANYTQAKTGVCTDINQVSAWNLQGESVGGQSCNLYIEPHPEFGNYPYYPSANGLIEQIKEWTNRPLITAYYPQQVASGVIGTNNAVNGDNVTVCDPSSKGSSACPANNPGIELLMGQVAVSGASELLLGDYDHLIPGPFFPRATLGIDSDLQEYLADYYNWFVGMRDVLRVGTADLSEFVTITNSSGTTVSSSVGAAGAIYTRVFARAGIAVEVGLTNEIGLSNNRIDDPDGLNKPTAQTNLNVTLAYFGNTTPGTLWYSAPDINHGFPQKLTYTLDSKSGAVSFTIPSLKTNALLVLESGNLTTTTDYSVGPADFIPGATSPEYSNGSGAWGGSFVHGCCGRYAKWPAIDFGTSGIPVIAAIVSSTSGGAVEFHEDRLDGTLLASMNVPSGAYNWTITAPVSDSPTGSHNIYVVFPHGDVTLVSWKP